jgi:alanine racemase
VALTLYVDAAEWHAHLKGMIADDPQLVPVAKGNGYGFGVPVLARTATKLGVDRIAVGTLADAAQVLDLFPGELLVLDCDADAEPLPAGDGRVLYTAASVEAAAALAGRRLVVDCRSSLLRQGVAESELDDLRAALAGRPAEGFSLHLPIDRPPGADPVAETAQWMRALTAAGFEVPVMHVSHLTVDELDTLDRAFPGTTFRLRTGTRLWLGERAALSAAATVHQTVPVRRGERLGYRQARSAHDGWLVMVSGGTAHGVGLEAPKRLRGLASRAKALVRYSLAAANLVRSPFAWEGRKLWFAEPPHMLVSMLFLPRDVEPPWPGAELAAELGHTSTQFDRVVCY